MRNGKDYELGPEKIAQYKKAYPRIDVEEELLKCLQWNIDNPARRKTERGILKHINRWLADAKENKGELRPGIEGDTSAVDRMRELEKQFTPEQVRRNRERLMALAEGIGKKKSRRSAR